MISEWWTYSLSDFLLFSPRAYYALIERYNQDVWPWHLATSAVGVAMSLALARPRPDWMRLGTAALGVSWLWIAWAFMWARYETINWAATWLAAAFAVQGVLLLLAAVAKSGMQPPQRRPVAIVASAGLLGFAVAVYPFVAPAMGRGWPVAEVFGIAPDPTAVGTLAWLAAAASGGIRWGLMVIPAFWCATTGATIWALGVSDIFLAPVSAVVAIAVAVLARR